VPVAGLLSTSSRTLHHLDKLPAQRQSDGGALGSVFRLVQAIERREQVRQLVAVHADAIVHDFQDDLTAIGTHLDTDGASWLVVLACVAKKIEEHLAQSSHVCDCAYAWAERNLLQ